MRFNNFLTKKDKKRITMQGIGLGIGKLVANFKDFYNDINGATLTGAIDVIVVEQQDGSYNCSPFHVRFGKIGVLRSREKVVDIEINGEPLNIHMKLGESGEAFFVEEVQDSDVDEIPEHLATSPIPIEFEELYNSQGRRRNSLDLGTKLKLPSFENEVNDYTKRRHTASNENKFTAQDFIKREVALGNIELGENITEDLSLSLTSINSNKISGDDIIKKGVIFEQPVQTNSLEPDIKIENKSESANLAVKSDEVLLDSKNGKKRRRKKSMMKKKNAQRKPSVAEPVAAPETTEFSTDIICKTNDSGTDRSSLSSAVSEVELMKEIKKSETEISSSNNRKVLDPDFHFFSDTELTSGPGDSRPISPTAIEGVLSDTEFEVKSRREGDKNLDTQSWAWGEFPSSNQQLASLKADPSIGTSTSEAEQISMLSTVFSFMKQRRQNSNNDGLYLADLNSVDPEVAKLYFTNAERKSADADMDCESGNGPSLTQSPNSADECKSIASDFDEHNKSTQSYLYDVTLSLCGWEPEPSEERFMKHSVEFSELCNNPSLLESNKLVVKFMDKYYNYKVAGPMIFSLMIYQRPLPQSTIDQLCSLYMAESSEKRPKAESRYSWFGWRRSRSSREGTPALGPETNLDSLKLEDSDLKETIVSVPEEIPSPKLEATEDGYFGSQSSGSDHGKDVSSVDDKRPLASSNSQKSDKSDKCRKTLRLSSDQIKELNLRDGLNEVEFSVTTAYQGTSRCKCHIYKWKWDDKIVISDIDGTITKSDVLGHILPIVGRDWAQSGVAQLFNKIEDNGYKLLYLSARAIGQAQTTREYLRSIKQGDLHLPDGPILLNPTSLITAFHREVIEKKPEQFKISCMSDIRALFPLDPNPFYAGYGNRINDVWAYTAVGIPIVRIFTINPKGELKHELTQTFQSSYSGQSLVVNDVFPPLLDKIKKNDVDCKDDNNDFVIDSINLDSDCNIMLQTYDNMTNFVDQMFPPLIEPANDYSQFAYWRAPLPQLDINLDEIK